MSARSIILLAASFLVASGCIRKKKPEGTFPAPVPTAPLTSDVNAAVSSPPAFLATLPDPLKELPTVGTWRPLKRDGAPRPCSGGSLAIWTGSVFFLWGQEYSVGNTVQCRTKGAFWDPLTDTWITAAESPLATDPNLRIKETRLLTIGPDLHIIPAGAPPTIYDPKTNQWRPGPPWITGLLWSPRASLDKNGREGPDEHTQRPQDLLPTSEPLSNFEVRPYLVGGPSTLSVLTESGLKSADLTNGVIKDWPAIPWPNPPAGGTSQNPSIQLLGRDDQMIAVMTGAADESTLSTVPALLAVLSPQSTPPAWRVGTPPSLTDEKGLAKCPVPRAALTTWADSRLVLVSTDSPSAEPKSGRTCLTAVDLASGAVAHSTQITTSQISRRGDDSYEYLDLTLVDRVASGRRVIFRIKRDGGRVSITDDAGTGFASLGYAEQLLVFDTGNGSLTVTPPLPGSATTEDLQLIPTDRGLIAWGGHHPKSDGTDEEISSGWILDWPL